MKKKLTPSEARRKLREFEQSKKRPWNAHEALFDYQRPIYDDKSPNRAVEGTRQFGKSRIAAVEIIDAGINNPGSDCAYVDMDIEHGGKVIWKEVFKLLEEYQVPAKVADGELKFNNGAIGYIFSGKPAEIKKLQGLKYAILIIDEVQEAHALDDILTMCSPALMRYNGRVLLLGIPGRARGIGPWWGITNGKNKHLFAQHRGSFRDNTALSEAAKDRLFNSEKERLGAKSSDFLRHWCGVWPERDFALLVYHYDPLVNGYDGPAPDCHLRSLGLDPGGVKDSEAVIVIGHGAQDGVVYHLDEDVSEKGDGGSWDDSGDRVGPMVDKWTPQKKFYDWGSAHKDSLTLIYQKDRHIVMEGVPSKNPYAESKRINQLLETGRLKIRRGSKLEADLLYTMWDEESLGKDSKPKYSKSYKQDAADGLRCAMWGTHNWMAKEKFAVVETDAEREAKEIKALLKPAQKYGPPVAVATVSRPKTMRHGGSYGPSQ